MWFSQKKKQISEKEKNKKHIMEYLESCKKIKIVKKVEPSINKEIVDKLNNIVARLLMKKAFKII